MVNINLLNGAAMVLYYYQTILVSKFKDEQIYGVELGSAYGGGVESLGQLWKGKGTVYGFDTFEGHPEQLAIDKNGIEARCMDHWYTPNMFGVKALSYEFQRAQLDSENLTNVILRKGLVTKDSCKDIPKIHYALLDMDILESMRVGYEAVKDKLITGSLLFIHDAIPSTHIPAVHNWWYDVMEKDKSLQIIGEWPKHFLVGVEKI